MLYFIHIWRALFVLLHRIALEFSSVFFVDSFRTLCHFVSNHSSVSSEGCVGLLSFWKTLFSDTVLQIMLHNALKFFWFHVSLHTLKALSARGNTITSKLHWTFSLFDCKKTQRNIEMAFITKNLSFSFIGRRTFFQVSFGMFWCILANFTQAFSCHSYHIMCPSFPELVAHRAGGWYVTAVAALVIRKS